MSSPSSPVEDLSTLLPSGALPVLLLRSVTGEGAPVFPDAATVRREVFTEEQKVSPVRERDQWDVSSLHVVAYVHVGATRRYHALHPPQSNNTNNAKHNILFSALSPQEQQQQEDGEEMLVPVGAVRLRQVEKDSKMGTFSTSVAKVERLSVRKDFRSYKVGALLMDEVEKIAAEELQVPLVILHAQLPVKGFYLKRGYEVKTEVFDDSAIDHVGMVKAVKGERGVGMDTKL